MVEPNLGEGRRVGGIISAGHATRLPPAVVVTVRLIRSPSRPRCGRDNGNGGTDSAEHAAVTDAEFQYSAFKFILGFALPF